MTNASRQLNSSEDGNPTAPEEAGESVHWECLVRDAVSGQAAATRQVLSKLVPGVRALCVSVLGREHPELDDAVQESLVEVMRALPQFRFESGLRYYAERIALRRAIGIRKKHVRDSARFPLAGDGTSEIDTAGAIRSPEPPAVQRRLLVRDLLTDLPERQAEAMVLSIMVGHSVGEVAKVTGVSVNTVKSRLALARGVLRRRISRNPEWRAAFDEVIDT